MVITGISDEAGKSIDAQIQTHKTLGWDKLELRLVNDKNVAGELSDTEFNEVVKAVEENDMKVAGFSSAIGNWSRPIMGDFDQDISDLKISVIRMKRLGTKNIRIMSWVGDGVDENVWKTEAIKRCKELAKIAEDAGITLLHENCTGWGGLSADNMLEIKNEVNSPAFKLLYDIGNVICYGMDPLEFFKTIRGNFDYVHVKDAKINPAGGKSEDFAYCGKGDAMVEKFLSTIILEDGYDGYVSIEPHIAAMVHKADSGVTEEKKSSSYIEYGKLLIDIIDRIEKNR